MPTPVPGRYAATDFTGAGVEGNRRDQCGDRSAFARQGSFFGVLSGAGMPAWFW